MIRETINNYRFLQENLSKLIEYSGYRLGYITDKMGMDRTSFYYKRKNSKFSIDEMQKLMDVIKIDELEDEVLYEMSVEAEQDGNFVPLKEIARVFGLTHEGSVSPSVQAVKSGLEVGDLQTELNKVRKDLGIMK